MPITDYSELKSAVTTWLTRGDVAGEAADFISLAEAALNRELGPVDTNTILTGTLGLRRISVTDLNVVEPNALFLAETGVDEVALTAKQKGTFPYRVDNGYPRFWSISSQATAIDFDCPLDQAYPFNFYYRQRFALSDAAPTNWLLTNHPDLYLAAVLIWGGVFIQDNETTARWASVLNSALPSVKNSLAQSKRSTLTVDPALMLGRRYGTNGMRFV